MSVSQTWPQSSLINLSFFFKPGMGQAPLSSSSAATLPQISFETLLLLTSLEFALLFWTKSEQKVNTKMKNFANIFSCCFNWLYLKVKRSGTKMLLLSRVHLWNWFCRQQTYLDLGERAWGETEAQKAREWMMHKAAKEKEFVNMKKTKEEMRRDI